MGILTDCGGGGAKFRVPPSMPPEDFYCAPAQTASSAEIMQRKHVQSRLLSTYFDLMTAGAPWRYLVGTLSCCGGDIASPSAPSMLQGEAIFPAVAQDTHQVPPGRASSHEI